MLTAFTLSLIGLSVAAAVITVQAARGTNRRAAASVRSCEHLTLELARVQEKRHTHQVVAMLEDLSAVGCDIAIELESFAVRQASLLARSKPVDAQICLAEFITWARDRVDTQLTIIGRGRRGPFSYRSIGTSTRPQRPGSNPGGTHA